MPKSGPKQARVEPIRDAEDINLPVTGWHVIDETDPSNEVVISEHETEAEAIRVAEEFEQQEE
ncbi:MULTISPECIES: hypothetical protein [Halomonadaceae]|uniref:Uncharacterized protein n=1 Tax=Billgrantia aerodenitrificans TaxID=2733483 RepID=A0ABS9AUF6_9GAMM|nr:MULTISPECIES: hypothetical protein [Halomonas]MCE8025322.1 hypothetical protein [Halomonas aerodenitrificans]MCE8037476.1 hypothetical protein [Halomonas sp. MCCC 1A11062]